MLDPIRNFGKSDVSTGYSAADTSVALISGKGPLFPNPDDDGAFNVVWWNSTDYPDPSDDPDVEIVRVTDKISDTFEVTRAQEGTSASAKNVAGKTYTIILALTKKTMDDIAALVTTDEDPISGVVDDSNLVFQFSAKPSYVVINGSQYREASTIAGAPVWTWSTPNVTLSFAPGVGGDVYAVLE